MQVASSRHRAASRSHLRKSSHTPRHFGRFWSLLYAGLMSSLAITGHVAAQSTPSAWHDDVNFGDRPFWMNVLYFQDEESEKTLTEVILEVPYRSFVFQKNGEAYEVNAEVSLAVEDAIGFQVEGNFISERLRTKNFAITESQRYTQIFHSAFRLEPASYAVRVVIGDEQTRRRFSYTCKFTVPSFRKQQPQISSLLLARQLDMAGETAILRKNGRSMIPNVPHFFTTARPRGFVYFEVYNLPPSASPGDSFQVDCSVRQADRQISAVSWKSPKPGARAAISLPLHLSNLEPGEYILTARVVDLNSRREGSAMAVLFLSPPSRALLGSVESKIRDN